MLWMANADIDGTIKRLETTRIRRLGSVEESLLHASFTYVG